MPLAEKPLPEREKSLRLRDSIALDNGLTWDPVSRSVTFPEDGSFRAFYESSHGNYSCTVDSEHFIWIIWENGALSRGRINRLGFAPKW